MKIHTFNYITTQDSSKWGDKKELNNIFIKIEKVQHFLVYYIDDTYDKFHNKQTIISNKKMVICLISTTNTAHSICEIISFIEFYTTTNCTYDVIINEDVKTFMPFMYQFLLLFIPENKIFLLSHNKLYKFSSILMYNCHHFIYTKNWGAIPFVKDNNNLYFEHLESIQKTFSVDSQFVFKKIEDIYNNYKEQYTLYDKIMIVKFDTEKSTTPDRGFFKLSNETSEFIEQNNIKIVFINNFKNIYEYICVLYHAKKVIFSYGGPCCTNRFFVNPAAEVIVLACKTYEHEYEYNNGAQDYWHVRHSHLCPVKKQTFVLGVDKNLQLSTLQSIL
jgi:hypothetical protein